MTQEPTGQVRLTVNCGCGKTWHPSTAADIPKILREALEHAFQTNHVPEIRGKIVPPARVRTTV